MKTELISKKENRLMKRNEMEFMVDHAKEKTPSLAALQHILSKETGKGPEHIEIKSLKSGKGHAVAKAVVFVWDEPKVADLAMAAKKEGEKKEEKAGE